MCEFSPPAHRACIMVHLKASLTGREEGGAEWLSCDGWPWGSEPNHPHYRATRALPDCLNHRPPPGQMPSGEGEENPDCHRMSLGAASVVYWSRLQGGAAVSLRYPLYRPVWANTVVLDICSVRYDMLKCCSVAQRAD